MIWNYELIKFRYVYARYRFASKFLNYPNIISICGEFLTNFLFLKLFFNLIFFFTSFYAETASRLNRRKARVMFSHSEEQNLIEGVRKYGVGSWAKILFNYKFHHSRTNVNLKDKYRTLQKHGVVWRCVYFVKDDSRHESRI